MLRVATKAPSRKVSLLSSNSSEVQLELDSHADTTALGKHALIITDYNRPVMVQGYDPALGSTECKTVSGVVGYTQPGTGRSYHLVIHQALHIPALDHHLLCPMQCRVNGVVVNECPKFLCPDASNYSHALIVPGPDDYEADVVLPLSLDGVTSYLPVYNVEEREYLSGDIPRIELTHEELDWDPSTTMFSEQEDAQTDLRGEYIEPPTREPLRFISSMCSSLMAEHADVTDDCNLALGSSRRCDNCQHHRA